MKQVLQSLKSGTTEVADVPCPAPGPGQVLIRTSRSLISAGTERMLVEFGKAGWLDKARQHPDKVRQVIEKVRTDGLKPTIDAVRNKLDQPLPLGYSNTGRVLACGPGVTAFKVGDRIASNGRHAEAVVAPVNLCARVPEGVSDEDAAFTVVGAIALQGIRLIGPTLGECVVVTGLGLIGLVAVQLLRAHGCRVLGLDFDPARLELARQFGAETVDLAAGADPVQAGIAFSRGRGVDAVLLTAATKSSEPVQQAARMSRKRGRIVLVGVTGLELSRADFYEKELTFQVSCSYGPGRYDADYEERGHDYPAGFVRWTEQRNFEAVLDMMADGRLNVKPLVSHRFAVAEAPAAYELIGGKTPSLGVVLDYGGPDAVSDADIMHPVTRVAPAPALAAPVCAGFIGSGNYASAVLIPAFAAAGARLKSIASAGGVSGRHQARKHGFEEATTDVVAMLADPAINTIVIATRHDSHADLTCRALAAGKHVFVEKPLALTLDDLSRIAAAHAEAERTTGRRIVLSVGFNRRFAPHVKKAQELLRGAPGAKSFIMTVNAGAIPAEHWTQDKRIGGGRILGEAVHFVDLLRHLSGQPIVSSKITPMAGPLGDTATITLGFADGGIGTIHYFANGDKSFPKERLEVFHAGRILQIDNFRKMAGFAWPGFSSLNMMSQDKGQRACAAAFCTAIAKGAPPPISLDELIEVGTVAIALAAEEELALGQAE